MDKLAQAWASADVTQKGLLDLSLKHHEAGWGLVPECKGTVDKQPFVRRDTSFALLRELELKFSYESGRV